MAEPRLLVGHTSMVTYCIASPQTPGLVATSAEDGCICWFDMRCKDLLFRIEAGPTPVISLCFNTGDERIIYASCGTILTSYDVRRMVVCNGRSSFVASADDSGEIIDIQQKRLYKSLNSCHTNICTTVQFVPWKPWEVITGGLDSKLVVWDLSKGCPKHIMDLARGERWGGDEGAKMWNPAFVHSIAVPDEEMRRRTGKVCCVGRGDGVVDVFNVERLRGRRTIGTHNSAVSCVAFSEFGERGRLVISGSNDRHVKIWDSGCSQRLLRDFRLSKKVNWLCTTASDSENLVVCDTSKTAKVYTLLG